MYIYYLVFFIIYFIYLIRVNIVDSIHNFNIIPFLNDFYYNLIYLFIILSCYKYNNLYNYFNKFFIKNKNILLIMLKNINNTVILYVYINILFINNNFILLNLNNYIKYLYIYILICLYMFIKIKFF
jgi:hypothetical protein